MGGRPRVGVAVFGQLIWHRPMQLSMPMRWPSTQTSWVMVAMWTVRANVEWRGIERHSSQHSSFIDSLNCSGGDPSTAHQPFHARVLCSG